MVRRPAAPRSRRRLAGLGTPNNGHDTLPGRFRAVSVAGELQNVANYVAKTNPKTPWGHFGHNSGLSRFLGSLQSKRTSGL